MLYNIKLKKIRTSVDCNVCPYMDKKSNRCAGGIGKRCFEYDPVTEICIDPVTKLPLIPEKITKKEV